MDDRQTEYMYCAEIARELVGKELSRVLYVGMDDSEFPCDTGHQVDYGVDLETLDGMVFGLIWAATTPFHLSFMRSSVKADVLRSRTWNMSQTAEWDPFLRRAITWAVVGWAAHREAERIFPQDLELGFSDASAVWFSTLETDNVFVVFDAEIARRLRLGRFSEQKPHV